MRHQRNINSSHWWRVFVFLGPRPFAWPPALVLATNLYLPVLVPNFYLPVLTPNSDLPALAPSLYLPALSYNFIIPVRGLTLHIPTLSPQLAFVFTALAYDLHYRSGNWICIYLITGSSSSGSSNSSSNFFEINNTNICMLILVI